MNLKYFCPQIHIIPFDLGCVFLDVLAVNNYKNLKFADDFINDLQTFYKEQDIKIERNIIFKKLSKKNIEYEFIKNDLADNAICIAKLKSNLFCYILTCGVGIFVLGDFNSEAITNEDRKLFKIDPAIIANYQKKLTQKSILNFSSNQDSKLNEYNSLMKNFRERCWDIIKKHCDKKLIYREFSSNINYKKSGLSYVLTIYCFQKNNISKKSLNCLMYKSLFSEISDKSKWNQINEDIKNNKTNVSENKVIDGNSIIHFSWTGVCALLNCNIRSFEDIKKTKILSNLIKAELHVQSRWFIADNSMDNVNKGTKYNIEKLQRIESLIEFYQAELENEISANMSTIYKQLLDKIVKSSEVKKLYDSVYKQINIQKKIKQAHYQDKKRQSRLILNLFMAIFTASSLFKTINDLRSNKFDWINILLLGIMLIVAIGTVVFDYYNEEK